MSPTIWLTGASDTLLFLIKHAIAKAMGKSFLSQVESTALLLTFLSQLRYKYRGQEEQIPSHTHVFQLELLRPWLAYKSKRCRL